MNLRRSIHYSYTSVTSAQASEKTCQFENELVELIIILMVTGCTISNSDKIIEI